MPDQDRPFRLRQTDSRFAPVTRHDATGSSRRRTTLSAKGDSRRSWSDNGFHGRYVSAGEVEPGFHVEPEPSVGLMLQSWEIGMTPPRGPRTHDSPPSKPPSQTRAPWPATARRIATYHPYGSTRYAQSSARSPHASPACCHPKCPPGADSSQCPARARHAWLPYPSPRAISGLSRGMGDERPSQWRLTRCQAPRRGPRLICVEGADPAPGLAVQGQGSLTHTPQSGSTPLGGVYGLTGSERPVAGRQADRGGLPGIEPGTYGNSPSGQQPSD
jgi:hypothetical protein